MNLIKVSNQILAFALEICMLIGLGIVGFLQSKNVLIKYAFGIGLPLVAILLWAYFAAPRATHRLNFPWITVFKITLFSITALLLYTHGYQQAAAGFLMVALLNQVLEYYFERNLHNSN